MKILIRILPDLKYNLSMHTFYKDLKPIQNFSDVTKLTNYVPCPSDWCLILSDVKGSTLAIQNGKYREVNLMGASIITCIQNILHDRSIPFSFGGDGANVLIHQSDYDRIHTELMRLKKFSQKEFGLGLRIVMIPVSEILKRQKNLLIGKFETAPGNNIALFWGDGFALAEKLMKSDPSPFEIPEAQDEIPPKLENLSCRWSPIHSQNGEMAAILIAAQNAEIAQVVFQNILKDIHEFLSDHKYHPAKLNQLKLRGYWDRLRYELKLQKSRPSLIVFLRFLVSSTVVGFTAKFKKNLFKKFDIVSYIQETPANTDYKKLDGILKMVIDCTPELKEKLLRLLEEYHKKSEIYYGIHFSKTALMTCVVHELTNNQHIHFVDGGDGGYALAALQLKKQIKENLKTQ